MSKKKYAITHLGKTLNTDHWFSLSDEECEGIRVAYYAKPKYSDVVDNLRAINIGGVKTTSITNYYLKHLMAKVKLYTPKWSIEEALQSDDLIRYFYSRTLASDKVYPKENSRIKNFEAALRLSGGGVAMKPSNFPMKTVDEVLAKYNVNNNYYDFSCGWGVRLLSAMKNGVNYFGVDPNHALTEQLEKIKSDYSTANSCEVFVDIRTQGSEILVPEWVGTMGVAFSSPPYYDLEDYKTGEQSIVGRSYSQWLQEFMLPTLSNSKEYLIDGGYLLVNIKNYSKYALYDDTFALAESLGLTFVDELTLDNITRPSAKADINTDEKIMVFRKHNDLI